MEKINILVGKHCMEHSDIILSLCSTYEILTTDLSVCDSLCTYPTTIKSITLSAEEMLQFTSFLSDNRCLHNIGTSESSLLFIAAKRKIKVAVMDFVTQKSLRRIGH